MALSCAYPIMHPVSVDDSGVADYEIQLDGEVLYRGRVHTKDNGAGTVEVDISPVCRDYLYTTYEENSNLSGVSADTVKTFSVDGAGYTVCYNYNTEYTTEIADGSELNEPITKWVDPRQYIGRSVLTSGGISVTHSTPSGQPGSKITIGEYQYEITYPCKNRYALYYVNKNGGIDYLICSGKAVDKFSTERTNARLYSDMSDRLSFSDVRFHQNVAKKYELNTGWLDDDRSKNIDNLTFSPKVWIHDLENGTTTACIIDDSTVSVKTYHNDKIVNYTISVSESKTYIRK